MRAVIMLCTLVIFSTKVLSQRKYTNHRSKGSSATTARPSKKLFGPLAYRTLKETIGESYLMMPQPKPLQPDAFSHLMKKEKGGYFTKAEYEDGVDLVLRLDSVNNDRGMFTSKNKRSYFIFFDGDPKYFKNAIPKQDIDAARILFVNKPLWLKGDLVMKYDENKDTNDSLRSDDSLKTERFDKVTVLKITTGSDNDRPIRFVLRTKNNEIGFIDVGLSGTNMRDTDHYAYFTNYFFSSDPRAGHKFSPETWANIKAGKVTPGMSAEEVLLIWGDPDKIERSKNGSGKHEIWHYSGMLHQDLDFENSVLKQMN